MGILLAIVAAVFSAVVLIFEKDKQPQNESVLFGKEKKPPIEARESVCITAFIIEVLAYPALLAVFSILDNPIFIFFSIVLWISGGVMGIASLAVKGYMKLLSIATILMAIIISPFYLMLIIIFYL